MVRKVGEIREELVQGKVYDLNILYAIMEKPFSLTHGIRLGKEQAPLIPEPSQRKI